MIKITIPALAMIALPTIVQAQAIPVNDFFPEIFKVITTLFLIAMLLFFTITVLKRVLDYRLKNKIIEQGLAPDTANVLLKPADDSKKTDLKYAIILAGLGVGFTLIYVTLPLNFHSVAIMAFCLAASFFGYYLLLKKTTN